MPPSFLSSVLVPLPYKLMGVRVSWLLSPSVLVFPFSTFLASYSFLLFAMANTRSASSASHAPLATTSSASGAVPGSLSALVVFCKCSYIHTFRLIQVCPLRRQRFSPKICSCKPSMLLHKSRLPRSAYALNSSFFPILSLISSNSPQRHQAH